MSVEKVKGSANIPKGNVQVSREEALERQRKIIFNWPSVRETFFTRYSKYISASTVLVSSACVINVFHPILKFGTGTFTAVLPSLILPPALMYRKTENTLVNDVLLMKTDCFLCYQAKFLAYHFYGGTLFPGLFGLASASVGHNITIDKNDYTEYWKKALEIGKKNQNILKIVSVSQLLMSFIVVYGTFNEVSNIMMKIKKETTLIPPEKLQLAENTTATTTTNLAQ